MATSLRSNRTARLPLRLVWSGVRVLLAKQTFSIISRKAYQFNVPHLNSPPHFSSMGLITVADFNLTLGISRRSRDCGCTEVQAEHLVWTHWQADQHQGYSRYWRICSPVCAACYLLWVSIFTVLKLLWVSIFISRLLHKELWFSFRSN